MRPPAAQRCLHACSPSRIPILICERGSSHRNAYLPRIRGAVIDASSGSHVDLTMSISPVVVIFLLIWFGMVGGFASIALRELNLSLGGRSVLVMVAGGIAILAIGSGLFFFEALKARRLLQEALRP